MKKLLPYYFVFILITLVLPFKFGFNKYILIIFIINTFVLVSSLILYRVSNKVFAMLIANLFFLLFGSADTYLLDFGTNNRNMGMSRIANLESLGIDIKILIKNSTSTDKLSRDLLSIIDKSEKLIDKNNVKSYLDMAQIYESAMQAGYEEYKDKALLMYREYCLLAPNDAKCYAGIATLIIADPKQKVEALPYALKALELAPDEASLKVYNELVNYIEKL